MRMSVCSCDVLKTASGKMQGDTMFERYEDVYTVEAEPVVIQYTHYTQYTRQKVHATQYTLVWTTHVKLLHS